MSGVTEADVAAVIGRLDEIIIREIVRTQASRSELRRAADLAKGPVERAVFDDLPPRMQRLIDLLGVALPERSGPPRPRHLTAEGRHARRVSSEMRLTG